MSQYKWVASWCGVAMVMVVPWKVLEWAWFKPKSLEKYLRRQGLNGTTYKLPFGDTKEIMNNTKLEPMTLSDDIMPRVMPFVHKAIQNYGIYIFYIHIHIYFLKSFSCWYLSFLVHTSFVYALRS